MAKYSIEDTTLTAIGDAIREKTGKLTKEGYGDSCVFTVENLIQNKTVYHQFPNGTRSAKIKKLEYSCRVSTSLYNTSKQFVTKEGGYYAVWDLLNKEEDTLEGYIQDGYYFGVYHNGAGGSNAFNGKFEITCYDADGNIIQVLTDIKNTMTPLQMASEIDAIEAVNIPDKAFNLTDSCYYKFTFNSWNWFLDLFKDKFTTNNITNMSSMFRDSSELTNVPFDINCKPSTNVTMAQAFYGCSSLLDIPKITGKPAETNEIFAGCRSLVELKEESIKDLDWSYVDGLTSSYGGSRANTFSNCESLRKYPNSFLAHGNPTASYYYTIYYSLFNNCYSLDEIADLPVVHREASLTSNTFSTFIRWCMRLKKFTFETNEDGSPIVINTWSKQTIDLSNTVGHCGGAPSYLTKIGFTTDTQVKTDADYQALKDNPDYFAYSSEYSRYNHDSAVETINSLPDLSGGAGGNTIKFQGAAGAKTDGGAINTLTEEEIAVAAAKGWTVTFG